MKFSYGFVETKGYIAAIEAADAMVKAAKVEVVRWRKSGGALVMVIIKGPLDACRAAVDAGSAAADRVGQLVSANVIPSPYDDTETLIESYLGGRKKKRPDREKTQSPEPKMLQQSTPKSVIPKKIEPIPITKPRKSKIAVPPKIKIKKKTPPSSLQERLLNFITSSPTGITIKQLSMELKKPVAEVRKDLKKLMDQNVIEKVQQRYFVVQHGSKK